MNTIEDVIARWNSPEGHPYKGNLIDKKAYAADPDNIGCMCAQGQVLHLIGGVSPDDLMELDQVKADLQTSELLDISISHAILLRCINDSVDGAPAIVLTEPEKVLGPNAQGILAFWFHLDQMTAVDWRDARDAWVARDARDARDAWDAQAARAAWFTRDAWVAQAARAAWAAWAAWAADLAYCAVAEIAGAKWMPDHSRGEYVFLPMFGFANPDSVLVGKENK